MVLGIGCHGDEMDAIKKGEGVLFRGVINTTSMVPMEGQQWAGHGPTQDVFGEAPVSECKVRRIGGMCVDKIMFT